MDRQQIMEQVRLGNYQLSKKCRGKSSLWVQFAEIVGTDGAIVKGFVCCRTCRTLLRYDGIRSSNLNRHRCFLNALEKAAEITANKSQAAIERLLEAANLNGSIEIGTEKTSSSDGSMSKKRRGNTIKSGPNSNDEQDQTNQSEFISNSFNTSEMIDTLDFDEQLATTVVSKKGTRVRIDKDENAMTYIPRINLYRNVHPNIEEDENFYFGLSIAAQLKTLPPFNAYRLQAKIQYLLSKEKKRVYKKLIGKELQHSRLKA